jgi:hypothetical protein
MLVEVCANPRSPGFNHYLFEAVAALIRHGVPADPANLPKFEDTLFPAFDLVLQRDVQVGGLAREGGQEGFSLWSRRPAPLRPASLRGRCVCAANKPRAAQQCPSLHALLPPSPGFPAPAGVPPLRLPDPGAAHRTQQPAAAAGARARARARAGDAGAAHHSALSSDYAGAARQLPPRLCPAHATRLPPPQRRTWWCSRRC